MHTREHFTAQGLLHSEFFTQNYPEHNFKIDLIVIYSYLMLFNMLTACALTVLRSPIRNQKSSLNRNRELTNDPTDNQNETGEVLKWVLKGITRGTY
jgi:hypothetical protein